MNDYIDEMGKLRKREEELSNKTLEAFKHYNEVCDKVYKISPQYYRKPEPTNLFDVIKQKSEKLIIKHELLKLYHYYKKLYKNEIQNMLSDETYDDFELFRELRQVYVDVATVLYENFNCRDWDVSSTYEVYVLEERY
jgi:hypothetical protein